MKKMMTKLYKVLHFCGVEKEVYRSILPEMEENNRKNLKVFTIITAVAMLIMVLASFFDASLEKNRLSYLGSSAVALILSILLDGPAKKNRILMYGCMYAFCSVLYAFGIVLGTFIEPNEMTVSYAILLFAVPLIIADTPLRNGVMIAISMIAYTICAKMTQNTTIFGYNMTNIIPYGILSICVSAYMMCIKAERYVLVQKNRYLSESDQLTGLFNRRSFEIATQTITRDNTKNYTVYAFDLNGLKNANDTLGHLGGDELLSGAASCISQVFSTYGTCYRTGGDEFAAILFGDVPDADTLTCELDAVCEKWESTNFKGISISTGASRYEDGKNVTQVVAEADRAMYEAKARYYKESGKDRRRR